MIFTESQQQCLLDVARQTITQSVISGAREIHQLDTQDDALLQTAGNFVTLMMDKNLRGCIGSIETDVALINSVAEHAWSAAFRDPRFQPLGKHELDHVHISISILTPKQALEFETETQLLNTLDAGIDGLLIEKGRKKATFLPSVWESLTSPEEFLTQLKIKAGLTQYDVPDKAWCYRAISISEQEKTEA